MKRFIKLFDDFPYTVVTESWLAPGTSFDLKRRQRSTARLDRQPATQRLVDDIFEWTSRFSGFGAQLGRNIVVERESGSHILMLAHKHQDVNRVTGSTACRELAQENAGDPNLRGAARPATARTRIADSMEIPASTPRAVRAPLRVCARAGKRAPVEFSRTASGTRPAWPRSAFPSFLFRGRHECRRTRGTLACIPAGTR